MDRPLVDMHYAESGITGQPVEHLQGCNMAFARPWPLVDRALGGDAVYMELDLCLRAGGRGAVWYDERIAVDHDLGIRQGDEPGQNPDADPVVRNDLSTATVRQASWSNAYVLSKNTGRRWERGRPRRLPRAHRPASDVGTPGGGGVVRARSGGLVGGSPPSRSAVGQAGRMAGRRASAPPIYGRAVELGRRPSISTAVAARGWCSAPWATSSGSSAGRARMPSSR